MSDYTLRQLVREVEWNARVALATADDLAEVLEDGRADGAGAVVESLVVRVQKVVELLWPGRYRLADRVYAEASEEVRRLLGVDARSPLTHERCEPLYQLLQEPDGVRVEPTAGGFRAHAEHATVDLEPLLHALRDAWNRSAARVLGE